MVTTALYGAMEENGLEPVLGAVGVSCSPSSIAAELYKERFYTAGSAISSLSSFSSLKDRELNWGIKDGDRDDFKDALSAVLSPFAPLLEMLLCEGSVEIYGGIKLTGSNAYNNAVIPILEAIGCPSGKILPYEKFRSRAESNGIIKELLDPVFALIDKAIKKPVYTVTGILPNVVWNVGSGGLNAAIDALLLPFDELLSQIGASAVSDEIKKKLSNIDILRELSEAVPKLAEDVVLPAPDLKTLGMLGSITEYESKMTSGGSPVTLQYVQSDRSAVMITALRYLVGIIKDEKN